jgi:hypothetical protein
MAMMNSQNVAAGNQVNRQTQSQLGALAIAGAPPQVPGGAQMLQPSTQPPPQ